MFWDFGGVITTSPFEAFERFERQRGLPAGFLRGINSTHPDDNAWARFERGDLDFDGFDRAFAAEARARGHEVGGAEVARLLYGDIRPAMVDALKQLTGRLIKVCVTNNFNTGRDHGLPTDAVRAAAVMEVMGLFDHVVESSKVGVRKPEPRFYQLALDLVDLPAERVVYLDDLGINLKPARALGMRTIKVTSGEQALADLQTELGIPLV